MTLHWAALSSQKLCKGFIFLVLHGGASKKNLCNVQRGMPTAKATAAAKGTVKATANAKAMAMAKADCTSFFKHRVVYVLYSSVYFLQTLPPCYIVHTAYAIYMGQSSQG